VPFWVFLVIMFGWLYLPIIGAFLLLVGMALLWLFRMVEALTRRIPER
jgi:hypothetical protein